MESAERRARTVRASRMLTPRGSGEGAARMVAAREPVKRTVPPLRQGAKPCCNEMAIERQGVRNPAFAHHREAHRIREREILVAIGLEPVGHGLRIEVRRAVHDEVGRSTDVAHERERGRLNSSHVSISYAVFCLKK